MLQFSELSISSVSTFCFHISLFHSSLFINYINIPPPNRFFKLYQMSKDFKVLKNAKTRELKYYLGAISSGNPSKAYVLIRNLISTIMIHHLRKNKLSKSFESNIIGKHTEKGCSLSAQFLFLGGGRRAPEGNRCVCQVPNPAQQRG